MESYQEKYRRHRKRTEETELHAHTADAEAYADLTPDLKTADMSGFEHGLV